jgi:cell pole-organizing protein PopZ
MRQADEPTVEEILASIKKVIARDNRDASEARTRDSAQFDQLAQHQSEDDVLDLSEGEAIEDAIGAAEGDDTDADQPLIGEPARSSMRDSLAALAMLAEPGAPPQIVRSGETSLEGLVREMLRPMLAQWLDRNLPPLVEAMVAAEIRRIVGKQA